MPRTPVDLSFHINQSVSRGHPADFSVALRPVGLVPEHPFESADPIPHRLAVVREDTGAVLSVISDRYSLIPHQRILHIIEEAIAPLDVGEVPRGIYVDRQGARMRAIFKFPTLAKPVVGDDTICPCLKIQNTYDGTSRIAIHIGAFRFVCTNLAVGGGGVFAGGFMSVHAGEIAIEKVGEQLTSYLTGFEAIVGLYRDWSERSFDRERLTEVLEGAPAHAVKAIEEAIITEKVRTVYEAYNLATFHATHRMRTVRTAFALLETVNRGFQEAFPPVFSEATVSA